MAIQRIAFLYLAATCMCVHCYALWYMSVFPLVVTVLVIYTSPYTCQAPSQTCTYIHNPTSRTYPTLALWTANPQNVDPVRLIHQIVLTGAI